MGRDVFTRAVYASARSEYGLGDIGSKHTTKRAEQQATSSGKLEPLVDPSGFGVIRLSLPRVEKKDDGRYEMLVGTPMPIETRVDTTGSMGGNVDIALDVLPEAFDCWSRVLGGYDIQVATGIFGDVCDRFPLCRPQFEMDADKIVQQLSLMVPERSGGDAAEDPDLGIFGAAYLTRAYINRLGFKRYDFTVTDTPGRGCVSEDNLTRVFGSNVFEKASENGHSITTKSTISLVDIWEDLLNNAHAFVLLVGSSYSARSFWDNNVGKSRVINLPSTKLLPQVQAVIIGITEGTLMLNDVPDFLREFNVNNVDIDKICDSMVDLPFGVQAQHQSYHKMPKKGDLFDGKPDVWEDKNLWPSESQVEQSVVATDEEDDWKEDDWT